MRTRNYDIHLEKTGIRPKYEEDAKLLDVVALRHFLANFKIDVSPFDCQKWSLYGNKQYPTPYMPNDESSYLIYFNVGQSDNFNKIRFQNIWNQNLKLGNVCTEQVGSFKFLLE